MAAMDKSATGEASGKWLSLVSESPSLVVLTGAGVSTASGIPDFKQMEAEWQEEEDRQTLMSLPYFFQEPEKFWAFYRSRFASSPELEPTLFHRWIASLEEEHEVTVVTQNIDLLHERAGSSLVYHLHGRTDMVQCVGRGGTGCGRLYPWLLATLKAVPRCPACGTILKPAVSLFFEGVNFLSEAREAIQECDLLIVAGTSLRVGPANELPWRAMAKDPPGKSLWLNGEPPPGEYEFTEAVVADLEALAQQALAGASPARGRAVASQESGAGGTILP